MKIKDKQLPAKCPFFRKNKLEMSLKLKEYNVIEF